MAVRITDAAPGTGALRALFRPHVRLNVRLNVRLSRTADDEPITSVTT